MAPEVTVRLPTNQWFTHEFVNSLTSVRSLADLLVEYPGLDAGDRCRFTAILRDETERLVRLIEGRELESDTSATL
ncbi:hypothetical protein DSCA_43680 [Desulfosarcina alkanivorans]|jgi:nitrogen-specific signal transduction histidine kinase|uniref:histidine kinase n=1 Tax=Desulfosarcina alkanivorans TaxID=571177 RepID=A0A5K7YNQ5_9BACT|nr:hypothetical protein [Desulfosarcina alkanivorans]BBO70438.1 hypothetical protein DSCA_43680 [Desulfosarcina alkanivorans]